MNILLNFNSQHVNRKALLPSVNLFTAMFAMLLFESNFIMGQSYLPPNSATTYMRLDPLSLTQPSFFVQDYTKNHMIVRNITDDGYLQCMAGLTYINNIQMWCIRLIEVDNDLRIRWSKDINIEESDTVTISTTPFAICKSYDNSKYVITGIVDNRIDTSLKLDHRDSLTQRAFFTEIDTFGNVLLAKVTEPIPPNNFFRFNPLSITPRHNNNGYIAVGFLHTDFYYTQSQNQAYISLLDNSFDEIQGKIVSSGVSISPHPTGNETQRFDAFLKVKPIPNTDEYIICGSMTEDLFKTAKDSGVFYSNNWDDPPSFSDAAGSTQGYMSRINDNLNIAPMWEMKTSLNSNRHLNLVDFVIDNEDENILYAVGNSIVNDPTGDKSYGLIFEIDYQSGVVIDGGDLTIPINTHTTFWTNIYSDNNHVYLCGFNQDTTPPSGFNMLNPKVTSFLKSDLTSSNFSYYINGDNANYNMGTEVYNGYANLVYPPQSSSPNLFQLKLFGNHRRDNSDPNQNRPYIYDSLNYKQTAPTSYVPSSWLYDTERGFACIAIRNWQNLSLFDGSVPPSFSFCYPTVWANTAYTQCHDTVYEFPYDVELHTMNHFTPSSSSLIINEFVAHITKVETFPYRQGYDCTLPPPPITTSESVSNSNRNHFFIAKDVNENDLWKIIPVQREEEIEFSGRYLIMDITGRILGQSKFSSSTSFIIPNSRKGIYLIHIKLDNGLQETHRILKY